MSDAKAAWVSRVLGVETGRPGTGRGVAFRKLLLRWRDAQRNLDASLQSFGAAVLKRPDIQADPRLGTIRRAVAALPRLVPDFGGRLEDILDAGLSTDVPAELQRLSAEGVTAIDAYREKLAGASKLLELEELAANDLGSPMPMHTALDQVLAELRQQLAA